MGLLTILLLFVLISGCAAVAPPAIVPVRDQGNIAHLTMDEHEWPVME